MVTVILILLGAFVVYSIITNICNSENKYKERIETKRRRSEIAKRFMEQERLEEEKKKKIKSNTNYRKTKRRSFWIAGLYYRTENEKYRATLLNIGDELFLEMDPDNEYDMYAIKVYTSEWIHIGYVPQNISEEINDLMSDSEDYKIKITEIISQDDIPDIKCNVIFRI